MIVPHGHGRCLHLLGSPPKKKNWSQHAPATKILRSSEGRSLSAARWLSILFLTTAISSQVLHDFLARAVIRMHRLKLDSKALKGFVTRSDHRSFDTVFYGGFWTSVGSIKTESIQKLGLTQPFRTIRTHHLRSGRPLKFHHFLER